MVVLTSSDRSYDPQRWARGYQSQTQERGQWIEDIQGEIPAALHGTLFRNGPGRLEVGGIPIGHPFDGDGMICAFSLSQGRLYFQNRYVQTAGYVAETAANKILYRGVFGTKKPGGWLANLFDLNLKNIANTNVIPWGEKLLALWEAAEPHALDPHNLETLGLDDLDGALKPGEAFSAHPRLDPTCDLDGGSPCWVNFSLKTGLGGTTITILECDLNGKLLRRHSHEIPGFAFTHDCAITPNYVIFFQSEVQFNPLPYLLGFKGAGECLTMRTDRPTKLILIPRKPSFGEVKTYPIQAGFVFHHGNAFEEGDRLVVDSICYDEVPQLKGGLNFEQVDFATLAPGLLWRFTVNLTTGAVDRRCLDRRCCEFPSLHPDLVGRKHRYLYLGAAHHPEGNAPLQAIWKWDGEQGEGLVRSFAPDGFVSEPIFVPEPGATAEDGGWLLTLLYDGVEHTSKLAILDARNLNPVAIARLPYHIPYGLHGHWCDRVYLPQGVSFG